MMYPFEWKKNKEITESTSQLLLELSFDLKFSEVCCLAWSNSDEIY